MMIAYEQFALCIDCFVFFFQGTHEDLQLVQAFLLNDSLMIAAHVRRRKGPVHYRFQTLYELDNMAVVDVKDTDKVQCAFKILMFPDSHLYQVHSTFTQCTYVHNYILCSLGIYVCTMQNLENFSNFKVVH